MKRILCQATWLFALALGMTATSAVFSQTQTMKVIKQGDDQSLNKTLTEVSDKTEAEKNMGLLTAASDTKHDTVAQHIQSRAQLIPKKSTEAFEPFYAGGAATFASNVSANAHEAPPLHSSALMQLPSQKFYTINQQFPVDFFINRYALVIIISVILYTGATYSGALLMRIFIWKGHFEQAARIAERRLKRRPHDAKLCAILANIYLALNRHDERANEIYRKALRFDPATGNRSKITSLIVQYCKHEEEMDSEVWKVCGGALSA